MRILICLSASLLGATVMLSQPRAALAEGDQGWQTCTGPATAPNDRVLSCTSVIDGKTETSKRLAAANCNRHGLTATPPLEATRADHDAATTPDPASACAYSNRAPAYALKRQFDRAMAD